MSIYGTKIDWDGEGVYKGDERHNCKWCGDTGWMRTFGHDIFYNDAPCVCKLGQDILNQKLKDEHRKEVETQHAEFMGAIDGARKLSDELDKVIYIGYRGFYYKWEKFYLSETFMEDWACLVYPKGEAFFSDVGRKLYEKSI